MRSRGRTVAQDRVDRILDAVLEVPPAERSAFLAGACGTDGTLRSEVRSLLFWMDRGGSTLEEPAVRLGIAPEHLAPGATLGPYRIVSVLGEGGMGVVYRATDAAGGSVALKTVRAPGTAAVEGILREVQTLAALDHPGIVRIRDAGVEAGLPWYAMELLEGASLRARITALSTERPLGAGGLRRELTLVRQLCGALAHLHGEGVVHRDLKPDNVLVREDGSPVLMDFGLNVKLTGDLGREQIVVGGDVEGTVSYMAPEQADGGVVDARADLYALGCLLFEVVSGRAPFVGPNLRETLRMHRTEKPPRLGELAPGIPDALDRLVSRLLEKEPRKRIGHAGVVAAVLAELGAGGEPDVAHKPYLYRPAMTGRTDALSVLRHALEGVARGERTIACVTGESGGGKTRLLAEIATEARRAGTDVLVGECQGPDARNLEAFRGPLRRLASHCRELGRAESERVFGPAGKLLAVHEPSIATLPGQADHPEPEALPPAAAELRLFRALARVLDAGRSRPSAPLLLVLDDVQWADAQSLGFLQFLPRTGGLAGTLVLLACRVEEMPDEVAALAHAPGSVHVSISRLAPAEIARMVEDMLAAPAPPAFVETLCQASEGNPFHVTEYVRVAIQEGWLTQDADAHWVASGATSRLHGDLPLPERIRELVRRQADRLPPGTRHLLRAASVLGREDSWEILAGVAGVDPHVLAPHRSRLVGREILAEAAGGRFRFRHDKIREAVYEGLDAETRHGLHRAAAETLASRTELGDDERPRLARHWELAGERARARGAYLDAARHGRERMPLPETRRLYEAAVRLTEGTTAEGAEARAELASMLLEEGIFREADTQARHALADARQLGLPPLEAACLVDLATATARDGRGAEAIAHAEEGLAIARRLGDGPLAGRALARLAACHHEMGHFAQAQSCFEDALVNIPPTGSHRAKVTQDLALLLDDLGREGPAERLFEEALSIARAAGDRRFEAGILSNIGRHEHTYGRATEAYRLTREALAIMREIGDRWSEGYFLFTLQDHLVERGEIDEAEKALVEALAIAREVGDARLEGEIHYRIASRERNRGNVQDAAANLDRAESLLEKSGGLKLARCYIERGYLELAQGKDGTAALTTARAYFAELGIEPDAPMHLMLVRLEEAVAKANGSAPGEPAEAPASSSAG